VNPHRRIRLAAAVVAGVVLMTGCGDDVPETRDDGLDTRWGYTGDIGPSKWGSLSEAFETCAEGSEQSPIDIAGSRSRDLPEIAFDYQESPLTILNNGHTIEVEYEEGSTIAVDGRRYGLAQFHFHAPSEHQVDGNPLAAEIHLVHRDANGRIAVVGLLVEQGAENQALASAWEHLPAEPTAAESIEAEVVDADRLLPRERMYYSYRGSLTTPPCTEQVTWLVMTEPIQMSGEQLGALTGIVRTNNRPLQPLGERRILVDRD
jgi:carbonic anhydrase